MSPDFSDMLSALNEEGVEYLVVGGYALAAHGLPRATKDIDIWVRPTAANATCALKALTRFGAPLHGLTADDLATEGTIFQIGVAPQRIDVITSIDGVEFEDAWSSRDVACMDGIEFAVIGRVALVRNKRASGRPQDLADVARLEKTRSAAARRDARRPSRPPDIEADLTMLPPDEGGLRTPRFSGYRPQHEFGLEVPGAPGTRARDDGQHEYPDGHSIRPGETGRVLIWLLVPERNSGRLRDGLPFTVHEGPRFVARGRVTRVVNPLLRDCPPSGRQD